MLYSSSLFFQSERIEKGQGTWRYTAASRSNVTLLFRLFSFSVFSRDMQQQQKYPLQFWKYHLQDFNSNVLVIAFALSWTTFNLFSKTSWNSIFCWIIEKKKRHQEEFVSCFILQDGRSDYLSFSYRAVLNNMWNCTNIIPKILLRKGGNAQATQECCSCTCQSSPRNWSFESLSGGA